MPVKKKKKISKVDSKYYPKTVSKKKSKAKNQVQVEGYYVRPHARKKKESKATNKKKK